MSQRGRARRLPWAPGAPGLPLRLLVDLPNWVGDQVMAIPVVERLVEANLGGTTVLHVRPPVQRLFATLFPEAVVVTSPPKTSPIVAALRVARQTGRADLGLTLRHAARAKIFLRLAAATAWGSRGGLATVMLDRSFPVDSSRHQLLDAAPMLESLGLEAPEPRTSHIQLPGPLAREASAVVAGLRGRGGTLVGLAPAARWGPSKQWPVERFGRLAERLRVSGLTPVVVVGPGEALVAREVEASAGRELPTLGMTMDVAGLASLLAGLDLLVCNDSGPMHLAAGVGTPVVALFGPTDPGRTEPLGGPHRVLKLDLECAPCGLPRCPLHHHRCLQDLTVDRVAEEVLGSLPAMPRRVVVGSVAGLA